MRLANEEARLRSRMKRNSVAPWASEANCTARQRASTDHLERFESVLGRRNESQSPVQ